MNHLTSPEEITFDQEDKELDEFEELQDFFNSKSSTLDHLAELDLEDDEDDWNVSEELSEWEKGPFDEFDDWTLHFDQEAIEELENGENLNLLEASFPPSKSFKPQTKTSASFKEKKDLQEKLKISASSIEKKKKAKESKEEEKSFLSNQEEAQDLASKPSFELMVVPSKKLFDFTPKEEEIIQAPKKPKGKRGRKKGSTQANKELRRQEYGLNPTPTKKRILPVMVEPSKAAKALWKKPSEITAQDLELAHLLGIRPGEAYLFRQKPQPRIEPERHLNYEDLVPIQSPIKVRLEKPNKQATQNFYRYRHATEVFNRPEVLRQLLATHGKLSELRGMLKIIKNHDPFVNIIRLIETSYTTKLSGTIVNYDQILKEMNTDTEMVESIEALGVRTAMVRGFERFQKEEQNITLNNLVEMNTCIDLGIQGLGKYPWQVQKALEKLPSSPNFPADQVNALHNIERYLNTPTATDPDPLIKLALIHHSLERLHPFKDGNGRTARAMAGLYLVKNELLPHPILCLSKYFYETRSHYNELMKKLDNDPTYLEEYLLYYLKGIEETSQYVISMIEQVQKAMYHLEERLETTRMKRMRHAITEFLFSSVYTVLEPFTESLWVSRGTAFKYLKVLISVGALSYVRYGQFVIYKNRALLPILGMTDDGLTAISSKYQGKMQEKRDQLVQEQIEYSKNQPKRKRGRPRKYPLNEQATQAVLTKQEEINQVEQSLHSHHENEEILSSTSSASPTIQALQQKIQKTNTNQEKPTFDLLTQKKRK